MFRYMEFDAAHDRLYFRQTKNVEIAWIKVEVSKQLIEQRRPIYKGNDEEYFYFVNSHTNEMLKQLEEYGVKEVEEV